MPVDDAALSGEIPALAESKGWPEAMPDAATFMDPRPGQLIRRAQDDAGSRPLTAELRFFEKANSWGFDGRPDYRRPAGMTLSSFKGPIIVMGSTEWESYRAAVSARFAATRAKRDAARSTVDQYFATGAEANYGDTRALNAAYRYHNGIMSLKFSDLQWIVLTRNEFFSKGVTGPFQEFRAQATCAWAKIPVAQYRRVQTGGVGSSCLSAEGRPMQVVGSIFPVDRNASAYGIRVRVEQTPSSYQTLIMQGDRFVSDGFGSYALWK